MTTSSLNARLPASARAAAGQHPSNGSRSAAAIEARGLTKRFGDVLAVENVTFTVKRGSVVGFLGPNGAGKTTTLRMLLGLISPSAGSATINGRPYRQLPAPQRAVGAVLDSSSAHPGRTARNHLCVHALATGAPPSRVAEVLDLVELTEAAGRRVGGFSLGMRQRLGLATALLCDPEILILDEPGNGLDPEGLHWLRRFLRDRASAGRTVLISSHILAEVAQTADSALILNHGRLIADAPLAELTARAGHAIGVRTPRPGDLDAALTRLGAVVTILGDDRMQVTGISSEQLGTVAAQAQIPIFETTTQTPDLEQVFLRLTAPDAGSEVNR
ncbi:MAG: ABC transporter ATP-binding protein [Solirubrobacteraceae bacterium]